METIRAAWSVIRWVIVGIVLDRSFWFFFDMVRDTPSPQSVPFELWYGSWQTVLIVTAVFTLFVLGFSRPRRRVEWRNAGLYVAFLISLFTEMFGIPLTIFLLAPFLGLPPWVFGLHESHLWAFALDRVGLLPLHYGVYLVMAVSSGLIAVGAGLVAIGWATVYRGRGELVAWGIYRYLRHPQYLGLMLIVIAFNIQWPTLPTLLMAPVLIIMYVRLARREDKELAVAFGDAFLEYATRTPAFFPWGRGTSSLEVREPGESQSVLGPEPVAAGKRDDKPAVWS